MEESKIIPWVITFTIFFVIPFWRLFQRTGFKPALALIVLIPGGILVLIWVVAFAKWPAFAEERKDSRSPIPPRPVHDPSSTAHRSTASDSIGKSMESE